jgi:hypothetical protein
MALPTLPAAGTCFNRRASDRSKEALERQPENPVIPGGDTTRALAACAVIEELEHWAA